MFSKLYIDKSGIKPTKVALSQLDPNMKFSKLCPRPRSQNYDFKLYGSYCTYPLGSSDSKTATTMSPLLNK